MARKAGWEFPIYASVCLALSGYFAFSAIQGPLGVIARLETEAAIVRLSTARAELESEVGTLANKARRLSDRYLDLDLLDERARATLGYVRVDELVIR